MTKHCLRHGCGILVVDDDAALADTLAKLLRQHYPCVHTAFSGAEARQILTREPNICLVLADLFMPVMDGLQVLQHVRETYPDTRVILMTGFGTIETAVAAIKQGAEDYITKPFDTDTVLKKVSRLMEVFELKQRVALLEQKLDESAPFSHIVGGAKLMRSVIERAHAAAQSSAPVLLVGETGVGKEMFARAIHRASPRGKGPFVPVNCAALPRELVESEMFGHRKGSFTGAVANHIGLLRAADQGTLFLDEVADIPPEIQAKLLRVLEGDKVRPVGNTTGHEVDVRLVSASNRPLVELGGGRLRSDFFYRISTIAIEIPPLRERREDLYLLAEHFIEKFSCHYDREIKLHATALERLLEHSFPGNVRELAHILESAVAVSTENPQVIGERELRPLLRPPAVVTVADLTNFGQECSLEAAEKFAIRQAIRMAGYNKSRAASLLGISRGTLYHKLQAYGLDSEPARKKAKTGTG
jgi:DNA-binding NtrC family response regulator